MYKPRFSIKSLVLLTGLVALVAATCVWWNRPPEPQFWDSGLSKFSSVQAAEVLRHTSTGWTDWETFPIDDAKSLISIAESCPIFLVHSNSSSPLFPPPSTVVKIIAKDQTIELEILGSGFTLTTSDHDTLVVDKHRDKITKLVDPDSLVYERD